MRFGLLVSVLAMSAAAVRGDARVSAAAEMIPISFEIENGWSFDGRIELPDASVRKPWAVMLLGGGLGTAIDWGVPGIMTLDGKPTRDADTIANALLKRGFVVMRWHAIHRDDKLFAADGFMIEPVKPAQTVEQARKAMTAFRAEKVVPDDHIFLLGHSLGAARAADLIDEYKDAPGVVMLAGASLIPTELEVVKQITAESHKEFQAKKSKDANDRHEHAVQALSKNRTKWGKPTGDTKTKLGTRWPVDVLIENKTPTLLMVGSQDQRWLLESYAVTDTLRQAGHQDYTWQVVEGVGHQLSPEKKAEVSYQDYGVIAESKVGPIDEKVVQEAVNWIESRRVRLAAPASP